MGREAVSAALLVSLLLRIVGAAFAVCAALLHRRERFLWLWCAIWCLLLLRGATAWLRTVTEPGALGGFIVLADALLIPGTVSILCIMGSFMLIERFNTGRQKDRVIADLRARCGSGDGA